MRRASDLVLAVGLLAASGAALAGGSVSGGFGWRQLGDGRWEQLGIDSQPALQLGADVQLGRSPWYVTLTALLSGEDFEAPSQDLYDADIAVVDLAVGLKWMPDTGMLKPYLAGGLSSTGVGLEYEDSFNDDYDDSDQSFGGFLAGGAQLSIARHFVGALDLRWVLGTETVQLGRIRGDVDSLAAVLSFGYAWGGP